MIPFNYHHLYYFYVIAKAGSVSKAARELRLAQPTLSAQLKQFEYFLDKKLFDRTRRSLTLTESGRETLRYASLIFDLGKEFMDRQADTAQKGRVRIQIGVGSFVPKTVVTLLIEYLVRAAPSAYIIVTENTLPRLMQELRDHLLDAILCDPLPEKEPLDDLQTQQIARIPIVFCGHAKFTKLKKGFPLSLNHAPLILPTHSSVSEQNIRAYLAEHKLEPRVIAEVQDLEVVRRMVLDGLGVAPLNQLTIQKAPASNTLVTFGKPLNSRLEEKIYFIAKKRKMPHPLVTQISENFRI